MKHGTIILQKTERNGEKLLLKSCNVWKIRKFGEPQENDAPKDRRLIGCRWVFIIKRDGTHRARLVALGYSQVPSVDFTDHFIPVMNDVTFRVALTRMMMEELDCMLMDVETVFLYGEIE